MARFYGQCAICKEFTEVEWCRVCRKALCDRCRRRYFERFKAFIGLEPKTQP